MDDHRLFLCGIQLTGFFQNGAQIRMDGYEALLVYLPRAGKSYGSRSIESPSHEPIISKMMGVWYSCVNLFVHITAQTFGFYRNKVSYY